MQISKVHLQLLRFEKEWLLFFESVSHQIRPSFQKNEAGNNSVRSAFILSHKYRGLFGFVLVLKKRKRFQLST
jgi:hypothetical protein